MNLTAPDLRTLDADLEQLAPIPCDGHNIDGTPCEDPAIWLLWIRCCTDTRHSCEECRIAAIEHLESFGPGAMHDAGHPLLEPPCDWMPLA